MPREPRRAKIPSKPRRPKRTASRFSKVTATPDGIQGLDRGVSFRASYSLFLIREAWDRGADLEALADGFGPGAGTKGDWSAIRDSSPKAITAMLEAALNFLFGKEKEAVDRVK